MLNVRLMTGTYLATKFCFALRYTQGFLHVTFTNRCTLNNVIKVMLPIAVEVNVQPRGTWIPLNFFWTVKIKRVVVLDRMKLRRKFDSQKFPLFSTVIDCRRMSVLSNVVRWKPFYRYTNGNRTKSVFLLLGSNWMTVDISRQRQYLKISYKKPRIMDSHSQPILLLWNRK